MKSSSTGKRDLWARSRSTGTASVPERDPVPNYPVIRDGTETASVDRGDRDVYGAFDNPSSWTIAVAAMICLIVGPSTLLVSCFGVFSNALVANFSWGRGQVGAGISIMVVAITLASLLQGVLIDRFGARRVILVSIPAFASLLAALAVLPAQLTAFYTAWFFLPFAAVGLWPASYLKIVSSRFDRRLGLATGVANAGIGLGTIVVPPFIAMLVATLGLKAAFIGVAILALCALPIVLLAMREQSRTVVDVDTGLAAAVPIRSMFHDAHYRRIAIGYFLFGIAGTGLLANLVGILTSKAVPAPVAVGALSGFGILALVGRLGTGFILDRLHASRVSVLLAGSTVLSLLVLILNPSMPWLVISTVFLGLLSGGEFDVLAFSLRRYFGLDRFGRLYGTAFALFQMGAAVGATVLAISVGWTGRYDVGLGFLAVALVGSMISLGGLGRYPHETARRDDRAPTAGM